MDRNLDKLAPKSLHCTSLKLVEDQSGDLGLVMKRSYGGGNRTTDLSEGARRALSEFSYLLVYGVNIRERPTKQSLAKALTHAGNFFDLCLVLDDSCTRSLKCILASSFINSSSLTVYAPEKLAASAANIEHHFVFFIELAFAAMRMEKAGNAQLNIYRLAHCHTHCGRMRAFYYALYTVALQMCLIIYIVNYVLTHPPNLSEVVGNIPFAVLVCVYEALTATHYMQSLLALERTAFWNHQYSIMRAADFICNFIIPLILIPLSVMAVLHAANTLVATLTSASILFIPTIDNKMLELVGYKDNTAIKSYVTRRGLDSLGSYYYRAFDNSYASSNTPINTSTSARASADHREQLCANFGSGSGSGFKYAPHLQDLAIAGDKAMLKCDIYEACSHIENAYSRGGGGGGGLVHTAAHQQSAVQVAVEISSRGPGEFEELYFTKTHLVTPLSLFTKMEYQLQLEAPFAVVYLKLWYLRGGSNSSGGGSKTSQRTVEYSSSLYRPSDSIHSIDYGCFVITNIEMKDDCLDTFRICHAPSPAEFLLAMDFYTIFPVMESARALLKSSLSKPPQQQQQVERMKTTIFSGAYDGDQPSRPNYSNYQSISSSL